MYQLAPYVEVGFQNNDLNFGFGKLQKKIKELDKQHILLKLGRLWKGPSTPLEIKKKFIKNFGTNPLIDWAISFLKDNNYLIKAKKFNPELRHSRNYLYYNLNHPNPEKVEESLKDKHVVIVGAGGIGNYISSSLIGLGIGKLTLVDSDIIELSNLSRQIMFTEEDIGKSKIKTLKSALSNRNTEVEIETFEYTINSAEDFNKIPKGDLLVLSADSPGQIIYWANDYCIKNDLSFINVGYVMDIAIWGPFVIPGKTGCIRCQELFGEFPKNQDVEEINKGFRPPSIGPINMLASSLALLDIIKYLGNFGEISSLNKRRGLWTDSLKLDFQDCSKNNLCKTCSRPSL